MKARILFVVIFLSGSMMTFQAKAQEKIKEKEKEKKEDVRIVVAPPSATWTPDINVEELKRQSEELKKALQEGEYELQKSMRDFYVHVPDIPDPIVIGGLQDRTSSSLMLTKNFNEESASKRSTFEVEKDQKMISFQVNGSCEKGEIQVVIKDPSGKKLQEVVIDPSARIQWSKSINIVENTRPERIAYAYAFRSAEEYKKAEQEKSEKEKQEEAKPKVNEQYIGTWTIEVTAKNAKGDYAVKISTR